MTNLESQKLIESLLGKDVSSIRFHCENLYIIVPFNKVLRCMSILSSNSEVAFSTLTDCFAVDLLEQQGEFSIYYQLRSYRLNKDIFIVTHIKETDQMQSATVLFENANWYEREIFDMFGIIFKDHPDLRRILCSNNCKGFELLKDSSIE